MSERNKHLFRFEAFKIAEAAEAEAAYHDERLEFWTKELHDATEIVKTTAKLVMKE